MPGRDEHASEHWAGKPQRLLGGAALALSAVARALEAESDRLSLWIPVLFGSGILAGRGTGFGLIIGGAALALAAGFANAKLHTEMARAPLLAKEMRGVTVKGFVELYERRDKAKARITLRVIALGDLPPAKTPDHVRVTLSAETATVESGEALSLHTRSISRGCRSGAKTRRDAWAEALGCRTARSPSRRCRQARPMRAIKAHLTKHHIPASTAIPRNEA